MPDEYLTIKQAAARTGKAEITIRRLVQRIVKGTDSRRRALIQPSPHELAQHTHGSPLPWRISTKLLREQFPPPGQGGASDSTDSQSPATPGPIIEMLKLQNATLEKQLGVKDEQIKSLTTLVHSLGDQLNERLRESNVLMKGLQDGLVLPERTAAPAASAQVAYRQPRQPPAKKGSDRSPSRKSERAPAAAKTSAPTQPKKTGLLRRLFQA